MILRTEKLLIESTRRAAENIFCVIRTGELEESDEHTYAMLTKTTRTISLLSLSSSCETNNLRIESA